MTDFSQALRAAIAATGLSNVEVARRGGLSKSTLYDYLKGRRTPEKPPERLIAVLAAPHLREYATPRKTRVDPLIADLRRRHMPMPTRIDDELGPVRRCSACQTEWPCDEEFFYRKCWICRACQIDQRRLRNWARAA